MVRSAEDPFFALGNAVEARDLEEALTRGGPLHGGRRQPAHAARLAGRPRCGACCWRRSGPGPWSGTGGSRSPRDWEAQVFPTIPAAEVGKKKPFGFWMKYQASTRFERAELLQGLVALHEADVAMKSGQDARLRLERVLLGLLGQHIASRRAP